MDTSQEIGVNRLKSVKERSNLIVVRFPFLSVRSLRAEDDACVRTATDDRMIEAAGQHTEAGRSNDARAILRIERTSRTNEKVRMRSARADHVNSIEVGKGDTLKK